MTVEGPSIPVVAFVGRSGSGKTTLLAQVITELERLGVRVAAVKHVPQHDIVSDAVGSDTYRFWEAGAASVVLVGKDRVVKTRRHAEEPEVAALVADLDYVQLILLEGFKRSCYEKIEVVRAACDPVPLPGLDRRIAFVTDVPLPDPDCAVFGFGEVVKLVAFLMRRYLDR